MSASRLVLLASAGWLTLVPPAAAQLLGDRQQVECGNLVDGDMVDSDVKIVCVHLNGMSTAEFADNMRLALSSQPVDKQELFARLDALLPASSRLQVEAIRSFFAILKETETAPDKLQERFAEIAQHYIELRDRQGALVTDDPAIRALNEQASAAIDGGRYDEADAFLTRAEEAEIASAGQHLLNAAATRARRGDISLTRLRYLEAADHFAAAAEMVPAGDDEQRAGYLAQQGEALDLGDRTVAAIAAYEAATALNPDVTWSWIFLGRLQARAGDLAKAERSFVQARRAAKKAGDERDLGVMDDELGDVRVTQGDLGGALAAYQAALAIRERLAARDPGNSEWQRDLSISHNNLGDVRVAQGDLGGALAAYQAALAIRERLAARNPGNSGWQRNLSISHGTLGDVRVAQGDLGGALAAYQAALAIRERLAARDPGNSEWQRDLSVSHNNLGDVRVEQGDLGGALAAYQAALAIRERLAARDPGNSEWQRDLILSNVKLADLAEKLDQQGKAVEHWQAALQIATVLRDGERLAPRDAYVVESIQRQLDALSEPATRD